MVFIEEQKGMAVVWNFTAENPMYLLDFDKIGMLPSLLSVGDTIGFTCRFKHRIATVTEVNGISAPNSSSN